MKKLFFLLAFLLVAGTTTAMVRAGVGVDDGYYSSNGYYYDGYNDYWYGPGYYYGNYYSDYPSYYTWRRRYWGGPYYWRYRHNHRYWR